MPWERIGPCGGDGKPPEEEWRTLTNKMGLAYVRFICGEPPKGCKLQLHWFTWEGTRHHEIGLFWNPHIIRRAPWRYIFKCNAAIAIFDWEVPWIKLRKDKVLPLEVWTKKKIREMDAAQRAFYSPRRG